MRLVKAVILETEINKLAKRYKEAQQEFDLTHDEVLFELQELQEDNPSIFSEASWEYYRQIVLGEEPTIPSEDEIQLGFQQHIQNCEKHYRKVITNLEE